MRRGGRKRNGVGRVREPRIVEHLHAVAVETILSPPPPPVRRPRRRSPLQSARRSRTLGLRILANGADAARALAAFREARRCYEQAGRLDEWESVVKEVRVRHAGKRDFMAGFERLVLTLPSGALKLQAVRRDPEEE